MNVIFLIIMVLLGFSLQFGSDKINIYAHLGGFFTGIMLLPILQKPVQDTDGAFCLYKYWLYVCSVLLLIFLISSFVVIFTL